VCTRDERQNFLLSDFQFKCTCKACSKDYPLLAGLSKCDSNYKNPPANVKSVDEARTILAQNFQYIKDNMRVFPSFEVCTAMQSSFRQLQFLAGKKFLVEKL
jgi:hypothetical protein